MELTSGREGPRIQGFQFYLGYSISELLGNPRGSLTAKGTDDQALCLRPNQSSVAFIWFILLASHLTFCLNYEA